MEQQLALYAGLVATGALAPVLIYWPVWRKKERDLASKDAHIEHLYQSRRILREAYDILHAESALVGRDLVSAFTELNTLRAMKAKRNRSAQQRARDKAAQAISAKPSNGGDVARVA